MDRCVQWVGPDNGRNEKGCSVKRGADCNGEGRHWDFGEMKNAAEKTGLLMLTFDQINRRDLQACRASRTRFR